MVEAAESSGSLITAHQALELGRDVYAVPGRIFDQESLGTNALIADGALVALGKIGTELAESFPFPVDEAVLALLSLGLHDGYRAWKGFDWDAMDRLHEKGFISDPRSKAKSVVLTEEGLSRSRELFDRLFGRRRFLCGLFFCSATSHQS